MSGPGAPVLANIPDDETSMKPLMKLAAAALMLATAAPARAFVAWLRSQRTMRLDPGSAISRYPRRLNNVARGCFTSSGRRSIFAVRSMHCQKRSCLASIIPIYPITKRASSVRHRRADKIRRCGVSSAPCSCSPLPGLVDTSRSHIGIA
jgi:hypothetical protein